MWKAEKAAHMTLRCLQIAICQSQPEPLVTDNGPKVSSACTWKQQCIGEQVSMGRRLRCSHASSSLGEGEGLI